MPSIAKCKETLEIENLFGSRAESNQLFHLIKLQFFYAVGNVLEFEICVFS